MSRLKSKPKSSSRRYSASSSRNCPTRLPFRKGLKFAEIIHTAGPGASEDLGVRYKVHVTMSADGNVPLQREGFSYHVLKSPEEAERYFALPGDQLFANSPQWPKGSYAVPTHVYSMTNPDRPGRRELRCRIFSPRIVCMFHEEGSPAVIFVGLHVPQLETMKEEARTATLNKLSPTKINEEQLCS